MPGSMSAVSATPTPTHSIKPYPNAALDPKTNDVDMHYDLLLATHIVALVLTTFCVSLRIHVRRVIVREIAFDDWVLIAAQIAFVSYVAFMIAFGTNIQIHGLQKVYWNTLKMASLWEVPLVSTFVLVRAAIATFFLRILPPLDNKIMRWIIIVIFAIYATFMFTFMFLNIFQCGNPLKKEYNYHPHCISGNAEHRLPIAVRFLTMSLDWLMTMVPVVVVLRSASLSLRSKVSVICLMCLAGAGSTVSILTIVYNDYGAFHGPKSFSTFIIYAIFSLVENAVAIIVVSLAAMRPLFRKIFGPGAAGQQAGFHPGASFRTPQRPARRQGDNIVLLNGWDANANFDPVKQPGAVHTQSQYPRHDS